MIQVDSGVCSTNLTVNNTKAFTIAGASGGPGTTLKPFDTTQPVIKSTADVRFTLTGLTFTGAASHGTIVLQGLGEAVTIKANTFTANKYTSNVGGAISIQTSASASALRRL